MSDKIGVIVPVYKTEKYVAECIESILAQTYTNFRLILVDDGTPDNAGKICDEYAKKDNRITVIHQENAGVTRARAAGVEEASDCEWITFVDSDDTITTNALKELYSYTSNTYDIILCSFDEKIKAFGGYIKTFEYKRLLIPEKLLYINVPWGKLFRKHLFNDFTFKIPNNIIVAEDLIMNLRLAANSNKEDIIIAPECIYNYRIRANSTARTYIRTLDDEYNINYHKRISLSHSEYQKLIHESIFFRLLRWKLFWEYTYYCPNMTSSSFYIELKKDITENKFHLSTIDNILFFNTNPIIRFLVINFKKIKNTLKKK